MPPPPPIPTSTKVGEQIFFLGRILLASALNCLNTLWNILMKLGRNVDQDEMTCRIQTVQD